jgi:NADH:ubiquinone oxidoreductase subunit 4 (subunit M)
MPFIDANLLLLTVMLPLAGACYVILVPGSDRGATRAVSLAVALCVILLVGRGAFLAWAAGGELTLSLRAMSWGSRAPDLTLRLDLQAFPLLAIAALTALLVIWNELGRDLKPLRPFVIALFLMESSVLFALLVDDALIALAAASATTGAVFFVVALYGGAARGSVSLTTAVMFVVVDTTSLIALLLHRHAPDALAHSVWVFGHEIHWPVLLLATAGLARLCVLPLSAWLSGFVDSAPLVALALVPGFLFPLGARLFTALALPALSTGAMGTWWVVALVCVIAILWSGLLALNERNLRRLFGQALMFNGAAFALCFLAMGNRTLGVGAALVANMGLSLLFVALVVAIVERELDGVDGLALLGLADRSPRLFRLVLLSGLFVAACPGIGGGTMFWIALPNLAQAPFFESAGLPANTGLVFCAGIVVGWVLFCTGVATTWRRMVTPARRQDRILDVAVTWPDTIRAWMTAVLALILGLASPLLLSGGAP